MRFGCNKRNACVNSLALVVQKLDNPIDKDNAIVEFLILIPCIPWIVIYSVDSAIQRWSNTGLHDLAVLEEQEDNADVHKHTKIARYKLNALNTHQSLKKLPEFHTEYEV